MSVEFFATAALALGLLIGLIISLRSGSSARRELAHFSDIIDLEAHRQRLRDEAHQHQQNIARLQEQFEQERMRARAQLDRELGELERSLGGLRSDIARDQALAEAATRELRAVEAAADLQSYGFYEPHYDFETAADYSTALQRNRDKQKQMVQDDRAAHCSTNWTVEGSAAKGRKMINEGKKLMLRAFNGECDAAIAKVSYNNAERMETRIGKAFEAINKLGRSNQIELTHEYLVLKLAELRLTHEHQVKRQEEKEEQRRIREQMREEQIAQKEIDQAQREAEKEEARQATALETARRQLADAQGEQVARLAELVNRMEAELKEAVERKARAMARAQFTRSGHVYVISNIGSFGEGVYKIGMTRRLDPIDRVRELGGASVPFGFDVHAVIYAEDAPSLENALHREFAARRVNQINLRREFFRVSLEDVRKAVAKHHGIVTFVITAEAEEYRQTLAMGRAHGDVLEQQAS